MLSTNFALVCLESQHLQLVADILLCSVLGRCPYILTRLTYGPTNTGLFLMCVTGLLASNPGYERDLTVINSLYLSNSPQLHLLVV